MLACMGCSTRDKARAEERVAIWGSFSCDKYIFLYWLILYYKNKR